jgi:hypothetical protein
MGDRRVGRLGVSQVVRSRMKRRMGLLRHHPYPRPESDSICMFCTTSPTFGAEYETWEAEWAESEVGEGLEEIWERAVSLYTSPRDRLIRR